METNPHSQSAGADREVAVESSDEAGFREDFERSIAEHQAAGLSPTEARMAAIDDMANLETQNQTASETEPAAPASTRSNSAKESDSGKVKERPKPERPGRKQNRGQGHAKRRQEPKGHRSHNELNEHERWAKNYADSEIKLFLPLAAEFDTSDPEREKLAALVAARSQLAELSVQMRRGTLSSRRSATKQLKFERAAAEYKAHRANFIREQLEISDASKVAQKRALAALLETREDGALMGEEANYYLQKENSAYQRRLEKSFAWYRGKSKPVQIALGLGAAAGVGVLAGLTAGATAAGAVIGARFGRGYFSREANRSGDVRSLEEKQKESTLRASNYDDYKANYTDLKNYGQPGQKVEDEQLVRETEPRTGKFVLGSNRSKESSSAYNRALEDAAAETKAKRKSLAWALGGAAIGFGVGTVLENTTGLTDGLRDDPDVRPPEVNGGTVEEPGLTPEQQEQLEGMQERIDDTEAQIADELARREELLSPDTAEPETAPEPETTEDSDRLISERSEYLYGQLAGETLELEIPAGSNIWNQLEAQVDREMPGVGYDEKQRLVGNMLKILENEHPGRDLDLVYPGEVFRFTLPD